MSFRDTFTKNSGSENLQYDDTAAYHFCTTMLILVLLPLLWSLLRPIINPFSHIPSLKLIENKPQFKQKVAKFKKQNKFSYITFGFVFKVILLLFIVFALYHCIQFLRQTGDQVRGFDPYQILQVQPDAPIEKIKKSYRKLALKYHPDRNKNDPEASARFIMISKAYQCLTNQQSRENCLKFGNPEGSPSLNVGIALPSFLVKKENHVAIMGVVFFLVVIVLPICLIYYFSEVNKYDQYGMLQQSHPYVHSVLNQQFSMRDTVRTLSLCLEFKNLRITSGQGQKLDQLFRQTDEDIKKVFLKKKYFNYIKKAMVLIDARVTEKTVPPELEDDYRFIMKKIPILVKASVMAGLERSGEVVAKMRPEVFVGENALINLIMFGQRFIQGKNFEAESFEQLNFTDDEIEKIYKKKKKKKLTSLVELQENTETKEFLLNLLTPTRQQNVKHYLDYIPKITLNTIVHVAGHEEITALDVIQVVVTVTSNRKSSFCSSTSYPFLKQQGWYIVASQNNHVIFLEHFTFQSEEYQTKFNLRPHGKEGNYGINIKILSDCYFGLDIERRAKYEVDRARKIEQSNPDEMKKIDEEAGKSFMDRILGSLKPPEEEELSDKQD